jgi:mono/diheme cytochrome c family protein
MRIVKIVGVLLGLVITLVGCGVAFLVLKRPRSQPPSTESVARTPERLARGKYLAENVVGCMDCHSSHRDDLFGWPARPETYGQGGFTFDQKLGVPGVVQAQNITPDIETGIGAWSDGEVLRAMREGVAKNGRALFPMMPYESLRNMSDEDARSIVVYLRSLPPIKHAIPDPQIDFPINLLIGLTPQPLAAAVPEVKKEDHLAWGKYLTTLTGCGICHTDQVKGAPVEGMEYAGGWEMKLPWGRIVTPNITPDLETGIGKVTREQFIGRIKAFASMKEPPIAPKGRNTIMPWLEFAQMSEDELGAIYDYLRTIKPINHKIASVFPDAPT